MRALVLVLLASLAVATASACGSSEAGSAGDAASLAPAGARAVVEIDGDLESDQWRQARDLVGRFPDGDKLLSELPELDAAAGDRIVVVALDRSDGVVLTQPDDEQRLQSFLDEHDLVSRDVDGWTAVSDDAEALEAYERALERGTLEGNAFYEAAREAFPDEALATAYVRGEPEVFQWAAVALTAEDDGIRLAGRLRGSEDADPSPVGADLLSEVPGDALAVLAFGGGTVPDRQVPNPLGIDLGPLVQLFSGGGVAWARPGLPIPEVTALLPGGDAATVDSLLRTFGGLVPEEAELEGSPAKRVRAGDVTITYGDVDGRLVVTTASAPGGGGGLADDRDFQDAREAAGMPDETNGFVYVNLQRIVPLLGFAGVEEELSRNLRPLASVLAFSAGDAEEQEIVLFAEIR